MKKSTVIFGSCEEIVEQTRKPRLIEKRIQQNVAKKKMVDMNTKDINMAMEMVKGSALSMGLKVVEE